MVHHARHKADKVVYEGIVHKSSDIFHLANQMMNENGDVVGDKPVMNDAGEISMSEKAKQNALAIHYERLNIEFDWDSTIIHDDKVSTDWEQSFIVCLYKGKGDALDRGNYQGLKLTEQAMKIVERIVDGLITTGGVY